MDLWLPPKPAIIRAHDMREAEVWAKRSEAALRINNLTGFNVLGGVGTVSFTDHAVDATTLTTYDFSAKNFSIGTATATRIIVVGVTGYGSGASRAISSLSIGGTNATQQAFHNNSGDSNIATGIYSLGVSSGTTATISVTFSGACDRAGVGVWALDNVSVTPTATANNQGSNPLSTTINVSAGGVLIGYVLAYQNSLSPTYTWNVGTKDFDEVVKPTGSHTGMHNAYATTQSGLTVTCTPSSFSQGTLELAAFR